MAEWTVQKSAITDKYEIVNPDGVVEMGIANGKEAYTAAVVLNNLQTKLDTCTPNEECVSKAELEKFDGWLDNLLDSDDDGSQEDTLWLDGYDAGIRDAQRKLREVMDK